MVKGDTTCDNCGEKFLLHIPSGAFVCCAFSPHIGKTFLDDKKYNVWVTSVSPQRWTNSGQNENNPIKLSFEKAEILLYSCGMYNALTNSGAEIRLITNDFYGNVAGGNIMVHPIEKTVKLESEEARLARILTGVGPGQCACKMTRSQCVYHKD